MKDCALCHRSDNYRSLLSYGEIFLSATGRNIILADTAEGKPVDKLGRFVMVTPGETRPW